MASRISLSSGLSTSILVKSPNIFWLTFTWVNVSSSWYFVKNFATASPCALAAIDNTIITAPIINFFIARFNLMSLNVYFFVFFFFTWLALNCLFSFVEQVDHACLALCLVKVFRNHKQC